MQTFYIQYQLEDEAPDFRHVDAINIVQAMAKLKDELRETMRTDMMLEENEIEHLIKTLTVIEVVPIF